MVLEKYKVKFCSEYTSFSAGFRTSVFKKERIQMKVAVKSHQIVT